MRFNDLVEVYRAPVVTDGYGTRRDWNNPRRIVSAPGVVLPVWSNEKGPVDREVTEISVHIYLRPVDVKATDRVRVNGQWFEVYGTPFVWSGRTQKYMRITARRVSNGQ